MLTKEVQNRSEFNSPKLLKQDTNLDAIRRLSCVELNVGIC